MTRRGRSEVDPESTRTIVPGSTSDVVFYEMAACLEIADVIRTFTSTFSHGVNFTLVCQENDVACLKQLRRPVGSQP